MALAGKEAILTRKITLLYCPSIKCRRTTHHHFDIKTGAYTCNKCGSEKFPNAAWKKKKPDGSIMD